MNRKLLFGVLAGWLLAVVLPPQTIIGKLRGSKG